MIMLSPYNAHVNIMLVFYMYENYPFIIKVYISGLNNNVKVQFKVYIYTMKKNVGVSLSVKACRQFDIDFFELQRAAIDIGFKRFRLMTYWNEIEHRPDEYNFGFTDKQLAIGGE